MPLTPGQGTEQGMTPPPAEHEPREEKRFPITVDGERTFYTAEYEQYYQFIVDGTPAEIMRDISGMNPDREKLGGTISAYLRPSQKVFDSTNNLPAWYNETLGPIVERNHMSLGDLKPIDVHVLGNDFRWALEDLFNFTFPKQLQRDAARSMGQTEGTVPTLSVLMQRFISGDPERFAQLVEILLKRGPDGFVMAAFLAAPEEEKAVKPEETEPQLNLDNVVTRDEKGKIHVDKQAMQRFINTSQQNLREGFDIGKNNVSFDASDKILHPEEYRIKETPPKE